MKKVAFIPLRKIVSVFGFGQNNENDITSYFSYITVWWYSRVLISNECNMLHRQCIYIKRGMLLSDKNFCFPSHLFLTLSSSRYMSNAKLLSTIYTYIYVIYTLCIICMYYIYFCQIYIHTYKNICMCMCKRKRHTHSCTGPLVCMCNSSFNFLYCPNCKNKMEMKEITRHKKLWT